MPIRKTIDDCIASALSKQGLFLSLEYLGSKKSYDWECKFGHRFTATYNSVCKGRWCRYCAGIKKGTNLNPAFCGFKGISGTHVCHIRFCAKTRGIKWELNAEYLWNLYEAQNGKCALTGLDITLPTKVRLRAQSTASLDRIDSKEPYIVGNVQWVHKHLNIMKMGLPNDSFFNYCTLVVKHHNKLL